MAAELPALTRPCNGRLVSDSDRLTSWNLADWRRGPNRPELALTGAHLAELLLDHYPDERDAAVEHLDFAFAEFREMKMQPALERVLGCRGC